MSWGWDKFIKWQYESIFGDKLEELSEQVEVLKTALKKEKYQMLIFFMDQKISVNH